MKICFPTHPNPNSRSADKTPAARKLYHPLPAVKEGLRDTAPTCTDWKRREAVVLQSEQPISLGPRSRGLPAPLLHPAPAACQQASVLCQATPPPSPAASEGPGGILSPVVMGERGHSPTIPSNIRGTWRHSSHLHQIEEEPQQLVSRQDYLAQVTPPPTPVASEVTQKHRLHLHQLKEK